MTSLLIADDHPIVLEGLSALLTASGFNVVALCTDGAAAVAAMAAHDPDIAILDIQMPGRSGIDILRDIRTANQQRPRVIILTASPDVARITDAMDLEPDGLILKESLADAIVLCVEKVAAGVQWIDNDALKRVIRELARREARAQTMRPLSPREREVAALAARGQRNRDIADALGLAESTVKMHLGMVFEKLGVRNRAELAALGKDPGLERQD